MFYGKVLSDLIALFKGGDMTQMGSQRDAPAPPRKPPHLELAMLHQSHVEALREYQVSSCSKFGNSVIVIQNLKMFCFALICFSLHLPSFTYPSESRLRRACCLGGFRATRAALVCKQAMQRYISIPPPHIPFFLFIRI